ncbi:MAG: c-type cytochrome domain-containing protein, partial [Verrucomicrobiota bacterium]
MAPVRQLVSALFVTFTATNLPAREPVDFNREIRPILSDRCFHCHGPDSSARSAGLRLDTYEDALDVINPGDAEASELVARIFSDDPDDVMPPPDSHRTLTQQEKEILKQWIDEGAHYDQHWSFKPLADPEPPLTEDSSWPRNDIDRFILAKLEAEDFTPTPEASKERLLRRLAFDLTGL